MTALHFADILMILLVCGVIYGILWLVNRTPGETKKKDADSDTSNAERDAEKNTDEN